MKHWTKLLVVAVVLSMAGNSFAKVKLALWGDSRDADKQEAPAIISLLLDDVTDWDAQIHVGDFTSDGTVKEWDLIYDTYDRVDELVVKDKFFMCTSNHDEIKTNYMTYMQDILPGKVLYYHHVIKGSDETVHIIACDEEFETMPISWLENTLSSIPEDDYIVMLWHSPSWADISYKGDPGSDINQWMQLAMDAGADFVANGDAHVYVRTHVLDVDGKVVANGDKDLVSTVDPKGTAFIIQGTGHGRASKAQVEDSDKICYQDVVDQASVTFLTFEGNKTNVKTVVATDHEKVIDEWNWTQGWWDPVSIDQSQNAVAFASELGIVPNKIEKRIGFKMQGAKSDFSLSVYNAMGKKMWNSEGVKREGTKEVVWDYSGNNIGAGVYFVKFDTPEKKVFQNFTITE